MGGLVRKSFFAISWIQVGLLSCFFLVGLALSPKLPAQENSPNSGALQEVLTLDDCLNLAGKNNPEVQVSNLTEAMAHEDVKTAVGAFMPTVVGSASYWHIDDTATIPVIPGSFLFSQVGAKNNALIGATAVQPIYDGTVWANHKMAKKEHEVAKVQKEISNTRAMGNVKKAYYTALFYKEMVDLQKDYKQTTSRELEGIQERFKRGAASGLEVSKAEGMEASTRGGYNDTLAKYESSKDQLKRLIGYPLSQEIVLKGSLDEMTAAPVHPEAEPAKSEQMRLADSQYQLAKANTQEKVSEFFPKLYGNFNLYSTLPNLLVEPEENFNLHFWAGGSLQVPIFDGLRNVHQLHKAKDQERISLILKKELENQDEMRKRAREREGRGGESSLEGPQKTFAAAQKSYDVAKVVHGNRLAGSGDWLKAQTDWAKARVDYALAQLKYLNDQVDRTQFGSYLPQ